MPTPPTPSLPAAADPGMRFVAPAGRPTVAGTRACEVLAAARLAPRLDVPTAIGWLAWDLYSSSRTFFGGLVPVPPRVEISRRSDGVLELGASELPRRPALSLGGAADELGAALSSATRDALLGARCAGIPLSGGLDSSAVSVFASDAWKALGRDPARLRFYHLLPRSGPDEVAHARAVADHLGHPLVAIRPSAGDPFSGDEALRASFDFPTDGGGMAAGVGMASRMREDGVDVVLTGEGGDEAVGSVGGRLPSRGLLEIGARWLRRAAGIFVGSPRRRLLRRRQLTVLPAWLAEHARGLEEPSAAPAPRPGLRGERAARDRALRCARQTMIVSWWRGLGEIGGFATGHPFLDPRVEDLVVALPPRLLTHGGVEKGLLRRALAGRLPDDVRARPKDQPPLEGLLAEDLRSHGAGWLERYLRGSELERTGLVPFSGAVESLRAARAGDPGAIWRAHALVGLVAWCRLRALAVP